MYENMYERGIYVFSKTGKFNFECCFISVIIYNKYKKQTRGKISF